MSPFLLLSGRTRDCVRLFMMWTTDQEGPCADIGTQMGTQRFLPAWAVCTPRSGRAWRRQERTTRRDPSMMIDERRGRAGIRQNRTAADESGNRLRNVELESVLSLTMTSSHDMSSVRSTRTRPAVHRFRFPWETGLAGRHTGHARRAESDGLSL
jgi:hypothetical protein